MKSIKIEQGRQYYTFLKEYFNLMDNVQKEYNWLISSYECYPRSKEIQSVFSRETVWLSGSELTDIINEEDFQWVWGVLSGFSQKLSLDEVMAYKIPWADGNVAIWNEGDSIQHPLADIEIVAWDSSATIIKSKREEIINRICEKDIYARSIV